MSRQQLENYADVLLDKYSPPGKEVANYELKNKINERKLHELETLILSFPQDVDTSVKEEVAKIFKAKLSAVYSQYIM